jgi:glycerophosphoryl diester phosphodiesterase
MPAWSRMLAGLVAAGVVVAAGAGPAAAAGDPSEEVPALVIAHRGASADAPEHTFAAYDRAVEQNADVLECDLQLTADEVLVCVHDTTVDRTTGGTATGRVDSFTLEQLRAMDFGSWFGPEFAGASIVPFEEQLRCYGSAAPNLQFYAETKAPSEYGGRMEPALVKLLLRLDLIPEGDADPRTAPVIIQSFELASLDAVKQLAPSLPTAWLWAAPPAELGRGEIPDFVDVLAPAAAYLEGIPGFPDLAHLGGREVHTWTVDDPAVMDQLLQSEVDGIFSNRPATLRARVDEYTGRAAPRPVELERDCPGVAGTVTAASDDGPAGTTTTSRPVAKAPESSDTGSWIPPVLLAIGIVIGGAVTWRYFRRRP